MAMSKKAAGEFPSMQVEPRAKRRVFSIEFTRSIAEQAAGCSEPGKVGKLLRTHDLYSSYLADWRWQQEAGDLKDYGHLGRGSIRAYKPLLAASCDLLQRIEHLERENQQLRLRAVKAESLVEFPQKAACLLAAEVAEVRDGIC